MRYIQDIRCNSVLGAPPGASIDECGALPVRRAQYENGIPVVQSFWRPTEDELKLLNAGRPVVLSIWGETHAPICMEVL